MAKDSSLWTQAYESYKKYIPDSEHNHETKPKKVKRFLSKEPMLLQEEVHEIQKQIEALTKRKHQILRELKKFGVEPLRSRYFDRPILLYALKLEDDCWYIGMTRNVDRRFKKHTSKKGGANWTRLHHPLGVFEVRETGSASDSEAGKLEDDMTLEYVMTYGKDFVRGGGYCQMKPRWPDVVLQNE